MDRNRRIASIIAAATLIVAGVAILTATLMRDRQVRHEGEAAARAAALKLGALLDGAAQTARMRAETLAAAPVVRAGVETDAATVRDLARSDFVFRPARHEVIEVMQLGQHPTSLLRLPQGARALPLSSAIALDDGGDATDDTDALRVTVRADVMPLYGEHKTHGAIAVGRRVPLGDVVALLKAAGVQATLTGGPVPLVLTGGNVGAAALTLAVPTPDGVKPLALYARAPDPRHPLRTGAALVLLLLGLGAGALGLRSRPPLPPVHRSPLQELPRVQPAREEPAAAVESDAPLPTLEPMPSGPAEAPSDDDLLAGRFRVYQKLGQGSVAEVYLAQPADTSTVLTLKVLRRELADAATVERFLAGPRRAAHLQHACVQRVLDCGVDGGTAWVAMEYVEGCTLEALLRALRKTGERMPLRQSLKIVIGVCDALYTAHAAGLVHRDVKPSNILVGRHGAVKLGDFAGPEPVGRASDYLAPEQILQAPVDRRADVFAVGAILHELVTGMHPIHNRGELERLGARGWSPFPLASALRPDTPRPLDRLLERATQLHATRRPGCCRDMKRELELLLDGERAPSTGVLGDWVDRVRQMN